MDVCEMGGLCALKNAEEFEIVQFSEHISVIVRCHHYPTV